MDGSAGGREEVHLLGHAHIDLAWLWTKDETIHLVCPGTFGYVLYLMGRYGFLKFAQSSAQIYEWMESEYPRIFEMIAEKVKAGAWEPVGGSWSEHNANLLSGETLVRQYLYGKMYFREKFGVDVEVAWLPDSFGFAWTIPQILRKCGIKYFLTSKLNWQIQRMDKPIPFPYHIFWWEAPDGSRVLAYLTPGGCNQVVDPIRILHQLDALKRKHGFPKLLVLFGHGDHGGGPNRDMIERALTLSSGGEFPHVSFTRAHDYFNMLEGASRDRPFPVYKDELYIKTHRGTFTTEARIKKFLRRAERWLLDAEKLSTLAMLLEGKPYPDDELLNAWKSLLYITTHDILDGTSIEHVYVDVFREEAPLIEEVTGKIIESSLRYIASKIDTGGLSRPILVFNTLSWPRSGIVEVALRRSDPGNFGILSPEDAVAKSQVVEEDGVRKLIFLAEDVPAMGYKVYDLREGLEPSFSSSLSADISRLENEFLRVEVDPHTGLVSRIYDKVNGREVLDSSGKGNLLQLYEDRPPGAPAGEPAWNIYLGEMVELTEADSVRLVEEGPLRSLIRVSRKRGNSRLTQEVVLYDGIPYVEFRLKAYWAEKYKMLKASFPLSFENDHATYEIPYGAIQRYRADISSPTGRLELPNRSWEEADAAKFEVPSLRWADVGTADGSYGVALLNDSKYGYSHEGNEMKLSLLRGPRRGYPRQPESWADQSVDVGWHKIRYALYPHAGSWIEGRVVHMGYEFNYPLLCLETRPRRGCMPVSYSFVRVDPSYYIVSAVKKSEEGDCVVLRVYDPYGRKGVARVAMGEALGKIAKAASTDLLEGTYSAEEVEHDAHNVGVPVGKFEIVTLKLQISPRV